MTSRIKTIDKIKKLLALASDKGNENEACAAALKAQKLIADYDIQDHELADEITEPISVESEVGQHKNWRFRLAVVVARNFRCKVYFSSEGYKCSWTGRVRTTKKNIVFFGYPVDANAARLTFEHLYRMGNRIATKGVKSSCYGDTFNSIALGFVAGVADEMDKQCQALMLVIPKEVNDAYSNMEMGRAKNMGCTGYQGSGFNSGRTAGQEAVRSSRLNSGSQFLTA